MNPDVDFQVTSFYCGIVTLLALKRFDACVFTHVLFQVNSLIEGIVTLVTFIRLGGGVSSFSPKLSISLLTGLVIFIITFTAL